MNFSEKLQKLRKDKNISQEELAEIMNVSRQAVSKWESGQSLPDIGKLIEISNYFSVSIDNLIKDEQAIPKQELTEIKKVQAKTNILDSQLKRGILFSLATFSIFICLFELTILDQCQNIYQVVLRVIASIVGIIASIFLGIKIIRYNRINR